MSSELWRDLEAAFGCLTVFRLSRERPDRERLARAMLFFPVVGAAIGVVTAGCALALADVASHTSLSIVSVLLMTALSGGLGLRGIRALARALRPGAAEGRRLVSTAAVLTILVGKITMLAAIAESLMGHAVLLAGVLGRWAPVVLAHGARPVKAAAGDALAVGRVGSREFAWASVLAMGASLAAGEALGLLAVIAAALTATGLRLWAYRDGRGMTAEWLAAAIDLVELAVLAALAASSALAAG